MDRPTMSPMLLVLVMGVSSLGSMLTSFGLGVWIFRMTGSYTSMAMIGIATPLAIILTAPLAGYVADRYNKKNILICSDVASFTSVVLAVAFLFFDQLETASVALIVLMLAVANEFRYTATVSLIPQITPKERLLRINSIQQMFRGGVLMFGPVLGAVGLNTLGVSTLLIVDSATYFFSAAMLLISRSVVVQLDVGKNRSEGFVDNFKHGLRWVFKNRFLMVLLVFFLVVNAVISIFMVALSPYVLARGTNVELGLASAFMGAGMFSAGIILSKIKKSVEPLVLLIVGVCFLGSSLVLIGLSKLDLPVWWFTPGVGASISIIAAANQTIWQTHTPMDIQGKVIAVRSVAMYMLAPFSVLLSIPLVSLIFGKLITAFLPLSIFWKNDLPGALGLMISTLGGLLLVLGACSFWKGKLAVLYDGNLNSST